MAKTEKLHPVVQLARKTVEAYIRNHKIEEPDELTDEMKQRAGVFVSIHKHGELRGCIGTFEPTTENVAEEIMRNAVSSATEDPRFDKVRVSELPDLDYSVDILTSPVPVEDISKLDPQKDGIIVQAGYRRGLLLPDLEGVDTVDQQIGICRLKAGIAFDEPVKIFSFQVRRYK